MTCRKPEHPNTRAERILVAENDGSLKFAQLMPDPQAAHFLSNDQVLGHGRMAEAQSRLDVDTTVDLARVPKHLEVATIPASHDIDEVRVV